MVNEVVVKEEVVKQEDENQAAEEEQNVEQVFPTTSTSISRLVMTSFQHPTHHRITTAHRTITAII